MKNQPEYIVWRQSFNKTENVELHAVGFVIKESTNSLMLSLTNSYGKYIDLQKVDVSKITSRRRLNKMTRSL
ncbi:MAG: hypothetical protein WCP09_01365 [Candidatus Taylorbacteria bacterium]